MASKFEIPLTTENMKKLSEWQTAGARSVRIDMNNKAQLVWEDDPIRIWIFDFVHMVGFHIHNINELPTDSDLARMKIKKFKEQLISCNGEGKSDKDSL